MIPRDLSKFKLLPKQFRSRSWHVSIIVISVVQRQSIQPDSTDVVLLNSFAYGSCPTINVIPR